MILVLVLINGLLALAEFAIVSANKGRLQELAEQGDRKAQKALNLSKNPGDFLSTVQVGITLIGVLAGAFGGASLSSELGNTLARIPGLEPYAGGLALLIVVASITLLSLVIGELVPKRIALNRSEAYAMALAGPMNTLSRLVRPFVRLLSMLTDFVLRLLRISAADEIPPSENEIMLLLGKATKAGIFDEAEQDMVEGVFRLGDRRVGALITPRTEIEWLDIEDPQSVLMDQILDSNRSCFPVGQGSLDEILGTVVARTVLAGVFKSGEPDIMRYLQPPVIVPEHMPALEALEILRNASSSLLFVIDEFGGVQGLVTIGDLVESVVGDLPASGEPGDSSIVRREDGSLLVDGMYPMDQFAEIFGLSDLPGYDQGLYETLGGFMMNLLGRIPTPGDRLNWSNLCFEVVDMDGLRVDKVLVLRTPTE